MRACSGLALSRGRALILAVNKWDNIPPEQRDEIRRLLALKLDFVPFAPHALRQRAAWHRRR